MAAKVQAEGALKRQIGLTSATAILVGEIIAVGIFLTPAGMAKSLASPLLLLLVWVVMGAMALSGALCYSELAARFPEAGGGYVYLREAYGPQPAFLYGWMAMLVLDPGLTAAFAIGMATYVGYIVNLPPAGVQAVAVGMILLIAAVNLIGVKLGSWLIRLLTLLKIGLLLFIIVWGFGLRLGSWANFTPLVERSDHTTTLFGALASGMVAAFFSFGGWWDLTKVAGEVKEPARTLPRALTLGVLTVTALYILTSAVFLYLVPLGRVATSEIFAAQAGEALFGPAGARVFSSIVVISVLGSLAAFMMAAPRVYYAMARDRLFLSSVGALHSRFGTPARAIILQAVLASLITLLGTFNEIVAYFIFVVVFFVALTVAAVFVLRRKAGDAPAYRTPGYPWTPLLFLLLVAVLLVLLAGNNPKQAFLGVAVVALGVPVYHLFFRRRFLHNKE
ncbi:MAG TPA: amino acid permease [Pyrinomonadaceae bacterium]|jgi:APA family basic amino acid/polyamine antiporter